jgi:DNA mismatch repair protein MutS
MPKLTSETPPQAPSEVAHLTPMMQQYMEMKERVGDALLFFRMGDFYELFHEDAVVASEAMNITLTSRQKMNDEAIPMCGVPFHSVDGYIDRLLQQGFKIAICEQIEDPKQAKGIVKRDIVRLITPGTIIDGNTLRPKENNFLASIAANKSGAGFAYVDVSTGAFSVTTWEHQDWQQDLHRECIRVQPREVLIPDPLHVPLDLIPHDSTAETSRFEPWDARFFRPDRAYSLLTGQFAVRSLEGFGCEGNNLAISAAGALLAYIKETQRTSLTHINHMRFYNTGDYMVLDEVTRHNLELFSSHLPQHRTGSLLAIIDRTVTPMGGRLLRHWLSQPLCTLQPLSERQDAVAELLAQPVIRAQLRQHLETIADLERILSRVSLGSVMPRELVALRHSITLLPSIAGALKECANALFERIKRQWDDLADIETDLATTLVDDPPVNLREGRFIRPNYNKELDALRELGTSGKSWLEKFEAQERERTGVGSLRIGFNKVFGYYIEIRKSYLAQVPSDYQRKQTLVNAERFVTPALKEREVQMLRSEEEALSLEHRLYEDLRQRLIMNIKRIQQQAVLLSQLDVITGLAETAAVNQYCRPQLDMSRTLSISDGRHPILEVTYRDERFVPNDTYMDCDTRQIVLLTGPNMAGKSTYMRQIALLVILAQIGSFIPASEAHIGLVDRIFTRIGAQDFLAKGQSTFMVEMTETANILNNVTPRSIVLFDEVGRGTSTYDGMSIAWAVIEYLHHHCDAHPRTLFATHYHELTALADTLERLHNYHAAVREWDEKIVFLRKILPGSADQSYGVQVARLAGLPAMVLSRARQLLSDFETKKYINPQLSTTTQPVRDQKQQLSLFTNLAAQLCDELRVIPVEQLSPLEALNTLAELRRKAERLP